MLTILPVRNHRIGGYRPGKKPDNTKYHQSNRFQTAQLPRRVDLRKHMTEVEEQVGNSCVANAFVGAYEYLAKRNLGESGNVSRLFVYYNARAQEGCEYSDEGSQMFCAINALIEYGACCEDLWANDESLICEEPNDSAYEQASNFKIVEAEAIETDLNLWRHTLAEGHPIAFALNTFDSFDEATRYRGRVPMPKRSDNERETHGWHAMLCVGYSDKDCMFIVRNSWGTEWGDKGYCYIPYSYVIHNDYNGHDSWIIKTISDLDFSADVWENGDSVFATEDSLLLYNFHIRTNDSEGFIEKLEELCQSYVDGEEDYYFDYEENEIEDDYRITISNFDLTIDNPDDFLEELNSLCETFAIDEDYEYSLDSEEVEDEDCDDEDDAEDYEDDDNNEDEDCDEDEDCGDDDEDDDNSDEEE